jgi:hypothetical protein
MDTSGFERERDAPQGACVGDDRVAWPCIRPGWKVVAADGADVGKVDEIAGDPERDIFDGLAIATAALGKPRYVFAEQVGDITDGFVYLTINPSEVDLEPATTLRAMAPGTQRQHPLAMHQRIARLIRRRRD